MTEPTPADRNAYQSNAIEYLQKVIRLFGGYKKRSYAFLNPTPGQAILEVGCGTGDDAVALSGMVGPAGRVIGVDTSEAMLEVARAKMASAPGPVQFETGDVLALPFADATFDRVRADRVFQHVGEPERALAEMIRVVNSGGWLSALDIDWASLLIDSGDPETALAVRAFLCRHGINGSAGTQLYGLFKRARLSDVEVYAETVCVTEWPVANMIWDLEQYALKAAAAGSLTEPVAAAWIADLEARHQRGEFFGSITGFVVRGRKP